MKLIVLMIETVLALWPLLLSILSVATATAATLHVVLRKRDSRAVIGWVGLVWLAPLVGSLVYVCFGINRIQRRAMALKIDRRWVEQLPHRRHPEREQRLERVQREHPGLLGLMRLEHRLSGNPLLPGNQVECLINGDTAYPAMLKAIDAAQESIALLTYIFDNDAVGQMFREALRRARDRGVAIRVLIDAVGARYSRPTMIDVLERDGISVAAFLPTGRPSMVKYSNLRNHRKILVVDGRIAFTGGTNIREGHWIARRPKAPAQCLHFRIEGPVVTQIQEMFAIDWGFATQEQLTGAPWFPALEERDAVWAHGIPDGPDEHLEVLHDVIIGALGTASDRVWIITPYFLPESALMHALTICASRGVDLRIILPETNNLPLVQWAAEAAFQYLIPKGCRIFLTPEPFDHTKLMTMDGAWSLIGSTNWDPRSLRLNFEFNVACYDNKLAASLEHIVELKLQEAREVTMDDISEWRLPRRLRNGLARLLTPYL